MQKVLLAIVIIFLIGISIVSLFRVVDASLEIDDLKSQVSLQKKSLKLLGDVANQSLHSCALTTEKLDAIAKNHDYPVRHEKQSVFIGSFEFNHGASDCITKVEQVAL